MSSRRATAEGHAPLVVLIGGLDPTGHAGVVLDALVTLSCGCRPHVVVTAHTAQTDTEVTGFQPSAISAIEATLADLDRQQIAAVKIGMLGSVPTCEAVAAWLAGRDAANVVLDPVLAAGSGGSLSEPGLIDSVRCRLFPCLTVLTPNTAEAGVLAGCRVGDPAASRAAAETLVGQGPEWVLVKGGHLGGGESIDVLAGPEGVILLRAGRIRTQRVRGTGCILSTALACNLALGMDVPSAARRAKRTITKVIRTARATGDGVRATTFSVGLPATPSCE